MEINETVGRFLKTETEKRVDLDNAELEIFVEILRDRFFFSTRKIKGIGGLPVGTGGKAVSLLSGGIDSPVASFMLIKRGCSLIFAHFHSFPYADSSSKDKAVELVRNLNIYQNNSRLYLLPFGDAQKQIVLIVPEEYRVLIYRRLMMKVSSLIAEKEGAGALVTGESLGQVASQTLKNMAVVSVAADRLILRPLVGMDKEEIIERAHLTKEEFDSAVEFIFEQITFVAKSQFEELLLDAEKILVDHKKDSQYLALALKYNCLIFSRDQTFKELCPLIVKNPKEILDLFYKM